MLLKLAACAQGMNGLRALDTTGRWLDFILKVLGSHRRLQQEGKKKPTPEQHQEGARKQMRLHCRRSGNGVGRPRNGTLVLRPHALRGRPGYTPVCTWKLSQADVALGQNYTL